jgi:hypothetical protein
MAERESDYTTLEEIKTPMLILYEGNIACGKSTMMQRYANQPNVELMCEPLELWENFHGINLLELRYKSRERHEFVFQVLAYISRFEQMNEIYENNSVRMLERSLYSSFEVFVELKKKLKKRNSVRGQPWHETDRATHLVEHSSVDFNEGDIDIYNRYINHVQRNKKTK